MSKINQILQKWVPGTVATTEWLKRKGLSRQSVNSYKKSGWLERVDHGVYKRANDSIQWQGALYGVQTLQKLPVYVGGKSALEMHGYGHYVGLGDQQAVTLWKTPDVHLPAWFTGHPWNADLQVRSVTLFNDHSTALTQKEVQGIPVHLSTTERAALEVVYDIPDRESLDEVHYIMEGLASLRPSLLQILLEGCRSVKVKRLFLHLAEYYNHDWLRHINGSAIDLGSGKREIIKGGKLDKKYNIVVTDPVREQEGGNYAFATRLR